MYAERGKALEDVLDSCITTTRAWSDYQEAQSKTDKEALQRVYRQAKNHLGQLFTTACETGIDQNVLIQILIPRVPTGVLRDITSEI